MTKDKQKEKNVHILGICGTFMGGLALLAREKGFEVTGSDKQFYPPISTQLTDAKISLVNNYDTDQLDAKPDEIIIGNSLSRGQPVIEAILNQKLTYFSGPEWLANNILKDKQVIAVAGTHGKTTTTSLLAWILEYAGLKPGFLIGGIAQNFGVSARLGEGKYFVIEADEYDSAFFDKRPKFMHYQPDILVLNNLEFDHADIFLDLEAIKTQFQYLLRTVPGNGLIVLNEDDENLNSVIQRGCWTPVVKFGEKDIAQLHDLQWSLTGKHNKYNALAAITTANYLGVSWETAIQALQEFKGIKRRLEVRGEKQGIIVYDDFAHHPTAIKTTLDGLREKVGSEKIMVILECASNTMKMGIHKDTLAPALQSADEIIFLKPVQDWGIDAVARTCEKPAKVFESVDQILEYVIKYKKSHHTPNTKTHIILMSNGGFGGLAEKLLQALS